MVKCVTVSHFRAPPPKKSEHLVSGWFPIQEFPKSKLNSSVNISRLELVNSLENIANWTSPFQVDHSAARGSGKICFIPW